MNKYKITHKSHNTVLKIVHKIPYTIKINQTA